MAARQHRAGPAALVAVLLLPAAVTAQTNWMEARVQESMKRPAMVYDSARQRIVLFGSQERWTPFGETWEWDGVSWIHRNPATKPPARTSHALAYDETRQRVVMFGGYGIFSGPHFVDLWEWDGVNWTQPNRLPNWPNPRGGHAMAYDAARQRVIMFGGGDSANLYGDTWEWDGTTWTRRTPALSPNPSEGHAMTYDAARQRVVLVGRTGASATADTWEWDGVNWALKTPATSPPARARHTMAYDASRQRVTLFGGRDGIVGPALADTWDWDGVNWTQRNPPSGPSGRFWFAMAYDAARQKVAVFGGENGVSLHRFEDTWEWDGVNWLQRTRSEASPDLRFNPAMAYDASRLRVVLFGGEDAAGRLADTWEWNGVDWEKRSPAVSPSPRIFHSMAYDSVRQRTVLFGGFDGSVLGDTWEWDGVTWAQRVATSNPNPRAKHAMAYDAARQRTVLFGGSGAAGLLGDTWVWDGTNWTRSTATNIARTAHAMAYDAARQRIVMFGGDRLTFGRLDDTSEWDGTNWISRGSGFPSARYDHAMVYDIARQRVVMSGGNGIPAFETWEWNGTNWSQASTAVNPGVSDQHAIAYDAARQRTVQYGGGSGTWLYGSLTPAVTQSIGSACAGTNGLVVLSSNEPFLGNPSFVLDLLGARSSAPCLFVLASDTQNLSLGGGCTLYLNGLLVPVPTSTNASGFSSLKVSIPLDTSLRGGVAYAQAVVQDPLGAFAGLAFSAGMKITLGD